MKNTLYIIGTGPGDPELMTVKAVKTLNCCPVIVGPRGSRNGTSTAVSIISEVVELSGKELVELHFPMMKIHAGREPAPEVLVAWRHAAETVLHYIDQGKDVCFPTLGDPAIYSTGYYLYETLIGLREDLSVKFIPGVAAMSSCSASLARPLCLGDEMVAVVPATFSDERLTDILASFDTIVLMKVHRVIDRLQSLLQDCGLLDQAVLVEKVGMRSETVYHNLRDITDAPHYYSTILIRKNPVFARVLIN